MLACDRRWQPRGGLIDVQIQLHSSHCKTRNADRLAIDQGLSCTAPQLSSGQLSLEASHHPCVRTSTSHTAEIWLRSPENLLSWRPDTPRTKDDLIVYIHGRPLGQHRLTVGLWKINIKFDIANIKILNMHLTIVNIIKSLVKGGFLTEPPKEDANEDHAYVKGDIENRGPCPGLNALANMGYLYRTSY